jgi:hypothetical protein
MKPDERKIGDTAAPLDEALETVMAEIVRSIKNVRFGSVEITIHDSRVVQIERKEKLRFMPAQRAKAG